MHVCVCKVLVLQLSISVLNCGRELERNFGCLFTESQKFKYCSMWRHAAYLCLLPGLLYMNFLPPWHVTHIGVCSEGIGMDTCVIPLRHGGLSLVQTTDYIYPIVDDPYMMVIRNSPDFLVLESYCSI